METFRDSTPKPISIRTVWFTWARVSSSSPELSFPSKTTKGVEKSKSKYDISPFGESPTLLIDLSLNAFRQSEGRTEHTIGILNIAPADALTVLGLYKSTLLFVKIITSAEAAAAVLINDHAFPGSLISFPHMRKDGRSFINSSSDTSIVGNVEITG